MPNEMVDAIFKSVEEYLARSLKAFDEKIAARLAALPVPKDGEPGKDAPVVDEAALISRVNEVVMRDIEEAIIVRVNALLPTIKPKDGEPGAPGADAIAPSLLINDAGELVAVYADGETKTVGMVRGKDGNRGASVMDGAVDVDGQLTLRMSDGRIINVGVVRGKDGKDAIGKQGPPGRDATEVRVLPAIDEAKSYPEGTTALYRGGMIHALRTTEPIVDGDIAKAGWGVSNDGTAEESEQLIDDGRVLEHTKIYTSGKVFTRRHVTASIIYRGIWKDGDFKRGDSVTWDGSLWHCERPTKDKPGASMDWKLVAKRGRDGKDAVAIKGDKGDKGDPGRDLTHMAPDGHKYS